jgi:hypothetical protein
VPKECTKCASAAAALAKSVARERVLQSRSNASRGSFKFISKSTAVQTLLIAMESQIMCSIKIEKKNNIEIKTNPNVLMLTLFTYRMCPGFGLYF